MGPEAVIAPVVAAVAAEAAVPVAVGAGAAVAAEAATPAIAAMAAETASGAAAEAAAVSTLTAEAGAGSAVAESVEATLVTGDAHAAIEQLAHVDVPVETEADVSAVTAETGASPVEGSAAIEEGTEASSPHVEPSDAPEISPDGEVKTPDELKADELKAEAFDTDVKDYVNQEMGSWDAVNPMPDVADEAAMNEWLDKRTDALSDTQQEANINADMKAWTKDNPMPDTKDKDAFNKWLEDRKGQKTQAEEKHGTKDKPKTEKNEKTDDSESMAEIKKKVEQLKALQERHGALVVAIRANKELKNPTAEDKASASRLIADRDNVKSRINILNTELADEVTKAPMIKKIAIMTAITAVVGYQMISNATKG